MERYTIHAAIIDRPREDLASRAQRRLEVMMKGGAIDEVATLLSRGLHPDLPVMRALGVREIAQALNGVIDQDEAKTPHPRRDNRLSKAPAHLGARSSEGLDAA